MKKSKVFMLLSLIFISSFTLSACGQRAANTNDEAETEEVTSYADKLATAKINITNSYNLNQEFKVQYKAYEPDGVSEAEFKAKSIKEIASAGKKTPDEGKKLILVEMAVRGNRNNKGSPTNFNQIGDTPSPQFVIINNKKNISETETTYFSDGYTEDKKLFELTKITTDHDQWVNTAIVFQIDKDQEPKLALRFTNPNGQPEFYDIKQ